MNFDEASTANTDRFSFETVDSSLPPLVKSDAPRSARPTSFKPYKILYPTKQSPGSKAEPVDADQHGTTWVGLAPLAMVQKIVSMAAADGSADFNTLTDCMLGALLKEDSRPGQKRQRDDIEEDAIDGNETHSESLAEALVAEYEDCRPPYNFTPWPSVDIDSDSPEATRLDDLVAGFQLLSVDAKKAVFNPSFNRVHQAFLANVNRGKVELALRKATKSMEALLEVISAVEPKMNPAPMPPSIAPTLPSISASASTQLETPVEKKDFNFYMSLWLKANWSNPYPDARMQGHLANHLIEQKCVELVGKDIDCLEGLEENTNEYHQELKEITVDKISNWLVNTRVSSLRIKIFTFYEIDQTKPTHPLFFCSQTRKWRPAIESAFDKRRPATLLMEDSIRIYEGSQALRHITRWDGEALFLFDPKYTLPLREWRKAKKGCQLKFTTTRGRRSKARNSNARRTKKEAAALPSAPDAVMSAPAPPVPDNGIMDNSLDISPCTAFLRAGGDMMIGDDSPSDMLVGDVAAI